MTADSESSKSTGNKPSLEEIALHLDSIRTELEKIKVRQEGTRIYLEQWKADISPVEEQTLQTHRSAIAFAQAGLKTAALINGGALIALPAFVTLFKIGSGEIVISAAIFFCFGLLAAACAYLFAFLSVDHFGISTTHKRERLAMNLNINRLPDTDENKKLDMQKQIEWRKQQIESEEKLALRNRNIGVFLLTSSLIAFLLGAATTSFSAWSSVKVMDAGKTSNDLSGAKPPKS